MPQTSGGYGYGESPQQQGDELCGSEAVVEKCDDPAALIEQLKSEQLKIEADVKAAQDKITALKADIATLDQAKSDVATAAAAYKAARPKLNAEYAEQLDYGYQQYEKSRQCLGGDDAGKIDGKIEEYFVGIKDKRDAFEALRKEGRDLDAANQRAQWKLNDAKDDYDRKKEALKALQAHLARLKAVRAKVAELAKAGDEYGIYAAVSVILAVSQKRLYPDLPVEDDTAQPLHTDAHYRKDLWGAWCNVYNASLDAAKTRGALEAKKAEQTHTKKSLDALYEQMLAALIEKAHGVENDDDAADTDQQQQQDQKQSYSPPPPDYPPPPPPDYPQQTSRPRNPRRPGEGTGR